MRFCRYSAFLSSSLLATVATSGELNFLPGIQVSAVNIDTQTDNNQFFNGESNSYSFLPSLTSTYQSRKFNGAFVVNHNHITQDPEEEDTFRRNFTEYNYNAGLSVIDNVLQVRATGGLSFLNTDPTQTLVNDFFLGSEELTKTRNNTVQATFDVPRPKYLGVSWSGSFSKLETDQNTFNNQNLDNQSLGYNLRLTQGEYINRVAWDVSVNFQDTEGNQTNNDIQSRVVQGEFAIGLFSGIRLLINGRVEQNRLQGQGDTNLAQQLDFTSYGAGLEWFGSENRRIALTYNESDESDEEEQEKFVGVDIAWAFSSRTNFQATYSRRFFGESGSANFTYNTRNLRTGFRYSEDLTNTTRLFANIEDQGVFVCPIGQEELANCFQPDSLTNFQLSPDQQFVSFFSQVPELSEEIILRKLGVFDLGYQRGKVTASLSLSAGFTDFLETEREQDILGANLALGYQIGVNTTINLASNFSQVEFQEQDRRDNIRSHTLGFTHQLNRGMNLSLNFRYLDRDSELAVQALQDRRISLTLGYQF